jgi:quercetin dioxygenase-like cupin family protein
MKMRIINWTIAAAGVALVSWGAAQAEPLAQVRFAPDELKWQASPLGAGPQRATVVGDDKKAGVYVYRTKFPANHKVLPHFHPDERVVTVISGTLYMGYGDAFDEPSMKALPPGSVWTEPAKAPHYVWAKDGEVVIQVFGANGPSAITPVERK